MQRTLFQPEHEQFRESFRAFLAQEVLPHQERWAEVGMVAELEKHLVARGLKLIEPSVGAGFAVDEVVYGTKGEPEVLVAGGTENPAARGGKAAVQPEAVAAGAQ